MYSKQIHQQKVNQLMNDCQVFFAFNDQQFSEGQSKHPLINEGEKYARLQGGGFYPNRFKEQLFKGFDDISKWEKAEKRAMKQEKREACILYELNNYECFYVGDITDALPVLLPHFKLEEIQAVYQKHRQLQQLS